MGRDREATNLHHGGQVADESGPPLLVQQQLEIESVMGLSSPCAGTLAQCPAPGEGHLLAYAAGACAVVYDTAAGREVAILRSPTSNRMISVVAWTPNGTHLLAGEGPASGGVGGGGGGVQVWDVASRSCVQQLKGHHRHGVAALALSPDGRLLASTGGGHEGHVCVWDWRAGTMLARQALQAEAAAAVFTEDGSNLVAVGKGAYKVWAISSASGRGRGTSSSDGSTAGSAATHGAIALAPKPVTLKDHRGAAFVAACVAPAPAGHPPGSGGVYALVGSGTLVLMRATARMPDKAVDLRVRAAYAVAAVPGLVAVACAHGIVRLFAAKSLEYRGTLPRLLTRSVAAAAGAEACADAGSLPDEVFPDALSCAFSACGTQLAVAYQDRGVVVWDVTRPDAAERLFSLASHCDGIWDMSIVPPPLGSLPDTPPRVVTCSSDGTIRVWSIADDGAGGVAQALTGVIVANAGEGRESTALDCADRLRASFGTVGRRGGRPVPALLRCVRASPDGAHLAVGDERGNLRIYDLSTLELLRMHEAHDGVLLSLDFTAGAAGGGKSLLASGGRDGLVHLYSPQRNYDLVDTLDDHAAAVTGVRFAAGGRSLVSCSADGTIVFRVLDEGGGCAVYHSERVPRGAPLYDLALDPLGSTVACVGRDGAVRLWDIATGAPRGILPPERGAAEPVRVSLDPGGVLAVAAHADGSVRLHHLGAGRVAARAWGHGELVTAAAVCPELGRLISVSGDGCMFVWRLPQGLAEEVRAAAARAAAAAHALPLPLPAIPAGNVAVPPSPEAARTLPTASPAVGEIEAAEQEQAAESPAPSPEPAVGQAEASPAAVTPPPAAVTSSAAASPSRSGQPSSIGQTIRRVLAGRPLVPKDKLPSWAAKQLSPSPSPTKKPAGAAAAAAAAAAAEGAEGAALARPTSAVGGRWAESLKRGGSLFGEQPAGPQGASPVPKAAAASPAPVRSPHPEDAVVPADSAASGALCAANFSVSVVAGATEDDAGDDFGLPEDRPDWGDDEDFDDLPQSAAELAKLESMRKRTGGTQVSADNPVGPESLVQDLFKRHFDCLGTTAALAAPNDRRQSLSAKFFLDRGAPLSAVVAAAGGTAATAATSPAAGSRLPGSPGRALGSPARGGAASGRRAATSTAAASVSSGGQSQRARVWREGKMDNELEAMRAQLASLQSAFAQQQHTRGSPARVSGAGAQRDGTPGRGMTPSRAAAGAAGGAPVSPRRRLRSAAAASAAAGSAQKQQPAGRVAATRRAPVAVATTNTDAATDDAGETPLSPTSARKRRQEELAAVVEPVAALVKQQRGNAAIAVSAGGMASRLPMSPGGPALRSPSARGVNGRFAPGPSPSSPGAAVRRSGARLSEGPRSPHARAAAARAAAAVAVARRSVSPAAMRRLIRASAATPTQRTPGGGAASDPFSFAPGAVAAAERTASPVREPRPAAAVPAAAVAVAAPAAAAPAPAPAAVAEAEATPLPPAAPPVDELVASLRMSCRVTAPSADNAATNEAASPVAAASPAPKAAPTAVAGASATPAATTQSTAAAATATPSPSTASKASPASSKPRSLRKGLMALLGIDDTPAAQRRAALAAAQASMSPRKGRATPAAGGKQAQQGAPLSEPRVWPGWGGVEATPTAATPVVGFVSLAEAAAGGAAEKPPPAAAAAAMEMASWRSTVSDPPNAATARSSETEGGGRLRSWTNPMFNSSPCTSATAAAAAARKEAQQAERASGDGGSEGGPAGCDVASPKAAAPPAFGSPFTTLQQQHSPQVEADAAAGEASPDVSPRRLPQPLPSPFAAYAMYPPSVQSSAFSVPASARATPALTPEPQPTETADSVAAPPSGAEAPVAQQPVAQQDASVTPQAEQRSSGGGKDPDTPPSGMLGLLQRMRLFPGSGKGHRGSASPDKAPSSASPGASRGGAASVRSSAGGRAPQHHSAKPVPPGLLWNVSAGGTSVSSIRGSAAGVDDVASDIDHREDLEIEAAGEQLLAATRVVQRILSGRTSSVCTAAAAEAAAATAAAAAAAGVASDGGAAARQRLVEQIACSLGTLKALAEGAVVGRQSDGASSDSSLIPAARSESDIGDAALKPKAPAAAATAAAGGHSSRGKDGSVEASAPNSNRGATYAAISQKMTPRTRSAASVQQAADKASPRAVRSRAVAAAAAAPRSPGRSRSQTPPIWR